MPIYELVNPSDHITLEAPDDVIAVVAANIVSSMYGARNADGEVVGGLFSFGREGAMDHWLQDHGCPPGALSKRTSAIVAALRSFVLGDRDLYEFTIGELPAEAHERFRAKWDDQHRTSVTDICGAARRIAEEVAEGI